ncbi:MAG: prepilin-type N-terminal cleavage/methylation domain-containing protein, partial [Candidatus Atribacteria bacterium]|nr:prepilin-type N-terminal cleavage/methylation domain-containing protein [Candidatus Atribacteria bacterium]
LKINKILSRKIKFPLSLRGLFPFCHSRGSGNPSSLPLRGAKQRSNLSGFSLIELMIAITILAMAIFGIFHAYSAGFLGMADARDRTVATNYAREAMEDVKNMDFEKIAPTTKSVINANRKYRVDVNVSLESTNLKKVFTVVSWTNRNGITKTVETSMLVHFIEVFASDPAKIVLFAESYNILNTPINSVYATTKLTAVIKDIKGNTIIDWGERPGEGNIIFLITSPDNFGTFSNGLTSIEVVPINGKANTTFTSNGTMPGNFGLNVIEASVHLPVDTKTVADTTTIKITNGPVKINLEADPLAIKASPTNYSTITVSLIDASGQTLIKKEIFTDVEISCSVFGEGNLSTSTITIPFLSGDESDASDTIILNSTGNSGLAIVVATATDLESGKTDVRFLGPPVAISISANPNPMYVNDDHSKILVSLIDENGFSTNPTVGQNITISLALTLNDPGGDLEDPHSWVFQGSDLEGIINETKFFHQSSTGLAIITASGGGLPEASVTINVLSELIPAYIKLSASPKIIPEGNSSTIKAIVYDYSGKIISNYAGNITFTTDFGTFSGDNPVYTTIGVAEIELFSESSGTATIEASLIYNSELKESIEAAVVEFYGTKDHIELDASPDMVKTGIGNTSTITATVCDLTNIHVPEYTGWITFTTDFGTFSGDNPVYTTNGIATIELFSEIVGTATITASDGTILENNICEVEFYEETTLTLVGGSVACVPICDIITFDVEVAGENIVVDEMKISWSESTPSQRLSKIAIDDLEVYNDNNKSGVIIDIINTTLVGEINTSNIKLTFIQDMAGRHIEVIFYPLVSGQYPIEFDVP